MNCIGVTAEQSRNKIVSDGYDSIHSIVNMHSNDHDGFKKYFKILNKTYATSTTGIHVYYSPNAIVRFAAILFYYDQAVNGFHTIPDRSLVDINLIDEIIETQKTIYVDVVQDSDDDDDEVVISFLKVTANWVDFRDTSKL